MYPKLALYCVFNHEGIGKYVDSDGDEATEETHGKEYYDAPGVEWRHTIFTASARWDFDDHNWVESLSEIAPQVFETYFFVPGEDHYELTDVTVARAKKYHDAMMSAIQAMIGETKEEE